MKRTLGHAEAGAIVAGTMLGVGIFLNPPKLAAVLAPGTALLVWVIGGLVAMAGALCSAELGVLLPKAGGEVVYLKEAYGESWAFASGWLAVLAVMTGSIATLAVATVTYQAPVLLGRALGEVEITAIAAGLVIALTAINHYGARMSGRIQLLITALPIVLIVVVSIIALARGGAARVGRIVAEDGAWATPKLRDFAAAYLWVYFTYSGWNAATYVAGEVKQPERGLPRALVLGTAAVMAIYLLMVVGYLGVLGPGLGKVFDAGTASATALFGTGAMTITAVVIMVNILSTINGTILSGSRVIYALAEYRMFPAAGARTGAQGTPTFALWFQAAWSIVLVVSAPLLRWAGLGKDKPAFDLLLDYTTTSMLITGSLAVLAVMVLRRTRPGPRAYRTFGYPVTPILFLVSAIGILAVLLWQGDPSAWGGLAVLAAALGFARVVRRPSG